MGIELISEIVQKNNQDFPLLDANNIRGGFYQVNTIEERDNIPDKRKKEGMLCFVKTDDTKIHTYQWSDGKWNKAKMGSGGVEVVETRNQLSSIPGLDIGQLAYIKDEDVIVIYNKDTHWDSVNKMIVSSEEPEDLTVLWIDPTGDSQLNQEGNLASVRESIKTLQEQVSQLIKILNYGAIAGDSSVGGRTIMMNSAEPIDPNEDEEGEDDGTIEPDKKALLYTVPNISIKIDTLENFRNNVRNLIDGELIWITDRNSLYFYNGGSFIPISGSGEGGGSIPGGDDMSQEDIEKLYFNHLGFVNSKNEQYRLEVNESGNIIVYNAKNYDGTIGNAGTYGSYISDYLRINSIFIGGIGTNLDSFTACTHNFVELANGTTKDINLNGIYLMYRKPNGTSWESIALKGTIKAGSTFLIRGARCSYKSNITLDVDDYDMQWYNSSGNLIEFEEGGGCFYLVCSNEGKFNNGSEWVDLEQFGSVNPYNSEGSPSGYIDLVGVKSSKTTYTIHAEGGSPIAIKDSEDIKDCIFIRSFTLDPCSQAQKAQNAKKSSALWTYINMKTEGSDAFPYYDIKEKHLFVPKASKYNKNIYGTRTTFREDAPNMVNITFGIQATDSGSGATRCFNWVSVGYYDEYLEYKKKSEQWNQAKKKKSISSTNYATEYSGDTNVAKFIKVYDRIKWVTTNHTAVTTHKVILRNLEAGEYSYRVRRTDDDSYIGEELEFTVKSDSTVDSSFQFVHTTDQQAFNFYEYQAWTKSAYAISKKHTAIDFTINTGDATQNGNRESEWLDYYDGRRFLRNKEEMYTIGNNDLCGVIPYELGNGSAGEYKINHKNIQYYYTFECDEQNPQYFKYVDTRIEEDKVGDVIESDGTSFTYYMPSLYSFNYGKYHFICLNSEFAANTYRIYYNDSNKGDTIKQHAYYNMYKWLEKDIELYPDKNYIAFMHEIPFCIIVGNAVSAVAEARTATNGSKLNNDFSNGVAKSVTAESDSNTYTGGCCFSEFFQNHKVKLVLGGHKHTYSLSYPTKEKITGANTPERAVDYANPEVDKSGNNGVVYAMCQATGYKLVSNKELPGTGISWLRKYFPMSTSGASLSQYYPMYSIFTATNNTVKMESYTIYNIYYENGSKQTAFNINNQRQDFTSKNSTPIQLDTTNNYINITY